MKIRILTAALLTAALTQTAEAQTWIDVTDSYIQNASFDSNSGEGWEGDAWGFASPKQNAEHFGMNFDTYQVLSGLLKGKYRLSMKGYYRAGSSTDDWNHYQNDGDAYRYAQLYATSSIADYYTPIVYASSAALDESLGGSASNVGGSGWWWNDGKYIPNNMEAAYYWFEAGHYSNTLSDIQVGDDGELRIGTRKNVLLNSDWMCVDDFKLEYWGTITNVTSLTFSKSSVSMAIGEELQLTATILPENATYRKLTWLSTDTDIATVDENGVVKALSKGETTIVATTTDGTQISAYCNITVSDNGGDKSSLIINEIMAANIEECMDPTFNFGGFIEIYNPTETSASLAGYYISDDAADLKKWKMPIDIGAAPADGFLAVWFDHYGFYTKMTQVPFKLDCDGGTIYISDASGKLIVSQDYPEAIRHCSYARTTDGGNTWGWTSTPTPKASNATSKFASEQLSAPEVNVPSKLFKGTIQLTVNIPSGVTLRYTTNGSLPTESNGYTSYTGLFSFSKSSVYRFRFYKDGMLPSDVTTRSYILNDKTFSAPIISIVTDDAYINGRNYGIFVQGNGNGRAGSGQDSKCNWNMDWDRPVNFDFIEEGDEEASFSQMVNISACGGWSRAWTPHSFKLKAEKKYGINYMPYAFFPDKPYNKNKTLQVRNGGNDNGCRIKDAAIQEVIARSGIDLDCQDYRPAYVYINGSFYSTLNIREPNNKHFAYANKGIDSDEMDQFEYSPDSAYVQMEGTREMFERLYELSANASDDATYEQIKQILDIDEFCNYMAAEFYLGSSDWLNNSNNCKGYRPRVEGGKFRFVIFDLDGAFSTTNMFSDLQNTNWQTLDYLRGYYQGQSWYKEIEITTIWLNLLNNDSFRKQFIDAFCIVTGSVFEPTRCKEIINEIATKAATVMSSVNNGSPWSSANSVINSLNSSRQTTMISSLKKYSLMGLSGAKEIKATLASGNEAAKLLINGQPVPTNKFSGSLFLPVTIKAEAPAGYVFKGWMGSGSQSMSSVFPSNTSWKYYDKGSLDGKTWYYKSFDDSSWSQGDAALGYATGSTWTDYTTPLDYNDNGSKRTTFYFRKSFTLSQKPSTLDEFQLSFSVDDGCVVYVNGTEAGRFNMPSGTPTSSTYASTYGDQFSYPQTMSLASSLFVKGNNVIAVEVHNNDSKSSDIHWEAELLKTADTPDGEDYISTDPEFVLSSGVDVMAVFEEMSEEEKLAENCVPVRINEVSAGNSIYINDLFKKEDWVELYNTTDEAVDLEGMYLSDNINKPQKFQFASGDVSTVIEPHGYRVVWCDKKDAVSQLHASFKLADEDGSFVLLTSENGEWADTLQYCAHEGDCTVGRFPDGSSSVFVMYNPTIGFSNTVTSYDTLHIESKPDLPDNVEHVIARQGGLSITYSGHYLLVKSEDCLPAEIAVYTTSGQLAAEAQLSLHNGHASYAVSLPEGVYIAKVRDAEDNQCGTKFIIK